MGWALALHHVMTLRRSGHVVVHRVGGRTALFAAPAGDRRRIERAALLRRPTHARLHALLLTESDLDQASLAARSGLTRSRMSQVLGHLRGAGLVGAHNVGRRLRYHAVRIPD